MRLGRTSFTIGLVAALSACGGGGSSAPIAGGGGATPTPTPTPTTAACSLSNRQQFVRDVLNEWYLFPSELDTSVNAASYSDLQSYIDALVAPARANSKDRFFTYVTSIAEENAFFSSGSSAGFGIRLSYDTSANRVFVVEAFESGPGLPAGFDRGVELLSVGTSATTLQSISSLMASGGPQSVINALGPSTAGLTRVFSIRDNSGATREVTVSKADFSIDPVSDRYGAKIINDGGKLVGYVNLRTFISTADPDLRAAFSNFRAQGITEVIVDFRYNGGGLVSIAELMGDLLGGGNVGQVFSRTTLRASKSAENTTDLFGSQAQSIAATKIAFIGRGGTASASELVTNAFIPYLNNNMALVGANTFGKPVGQFGFDLTACDDRLRAVTFRTENASGQGDYYTGLASVVPNTCRANDDISAQLGDSAEASVAVALDFLAGRACTPIAGTPGAQGTLRQGEPGRVILQPDAPTPAQREVPGMF